MWLTNAIAMKYAYFKLISFSENTTYQRSLFSFSFYFLSLASRVHKDLAKYKHIQGKKYHVMMVKISRTESEMTITVKIVSTLTTLKDIKKYHEKAKA